MININVFSNEKAWSRKLKKKEQFFNEVCKAFPKKYKFLNKKISLSLLLSNNENIKKLNKEFRKKNKSTDILSFPFYEKKVLNYKIKSKQKEIYLGDIIINLNSIKTKGNLNKFTYEFNKIWIHGLAHLFGYTHKKNQDFFDMKRIEKKYINILK